MTASLTPHATSSTALSSAATSSTALGSSATSTTALSALGYGSAIPDSPYCYPDFAIPDDTTLGVDIDSLTSASASPATLTPA